MTAPRAFLVGGWFVGDYEKTSGLAERLRREIPKSITRTESPIEEGDDEPITRSVLVMAAGDTDAVLKMARIGRSWIPDMEPTVALFLHPSVLELDQLVMFGFTSGSEKSELPGGYIAFTQTEPSIQKFAEAIAFLRFCGHRSV